MKVSSALAMFVAVLSANAWLTPDATTFTNLSPRFTCWGRLARLEFASIGSSGVPVQVLEDSRPTRPAHFVAIPKSSLRSNAFSACHGKCCHVFLCNFPFHYEKNYSSTVTITTKWRWCNTNIKRTSISFWVSFKHWPLSTSAQAPTIVLMPSYMTNTLDTGLWPPPSSRHTKIYWFGSMSLWTFWSTLCR